MAEEQKQKSGRIYSGGSAAKTSYQGSAQSVGFNAVKAQNDDKAAAERRQRLVEDGATKARELQREQSADNLALQAQQKSDMGLMQLDQQRTANELEIQQKYDQDTLKQKHTFETHKGELETSLLSSQGQVASAKLQATGTAIQGLLSLSSSFIKYQGEVNQAKEQEQKQASLNNAAFPVLADSNAAANNVDATQTSISTSNADISTETAIQSASSDPSVQNSIRQEQTIPAFARDQQRRSSVYEASNDFGGFYTSWVNDDSLTYVRADGSEFTANTARDRSDLIQIDTAARNAFAEAAGVGSLPRAQVASVLAPTVLNTSNSWVNKANNEIMAANMAAASQAAIVDVESGLAAGDNLSDVFSRGAAAQFGSGASGRDKGAASETILDAMLDWAVDNKRPDIIEKLEGVHKRYKDDGTPIKGTELGRQYRDKFDTARQNVEQREISDGTRQENLNITRVNNARNERDVALANASSDAEETAINEQFERVLISEGTPQALKQLKDHRANGNNYSEWNHLDIKARQDAGEVISNAEFRQQVQEQRITVAEAKTLGYDPDSDMSRPEAARATADSFMSEAKGIAKGILTEAGGETARNNTEGFKLEMDTRGNSIVNQAAKDMVTQLSAWILSNPNATDAEQRAQLQVIKDNVGINSLKYDVDKGFTGYTFGVSGRGAASLEDTFTVRRKGPNGIYTVYSGYSPKQLQQRPDVAITRDQVLTLGEVKSGVSAMLSEGKIPKIILDKANALGTTADVLIRTQANAYGYEGPTEAPPTVVPINNSGPTDMRGGKRHLQSVLGVPPKSAAYLAANIQQESSWNGMRDWGQVAGDGTSRNGGLVSWASWSNDPARLGVIEGYLGKDISKATHAEQLKAMMWEMETNYPDQYRIFMNPNSSDRQLRRASFGYWGYGEEGERFGSYLKSSLAVN